MLPILSKVWTYFSTRWEAQDIFEQSGMTEQLVQKNIVSDTNRSKKTEGLHLEVKLGLLKNQVFFISRVLECSSLKPPQEYLTSPPLMKPTSPPTPVFRTSQTLVFPCQLFKNLTECNISRQ